MKKYTYKGKQYDYLYQVKKMLPNVGIPDSVTDEQLAELGITAIDVEPSLDELKKAKLQQLKWERDRKETLPITYKDKSFDYDDKARERMRIAQQALEDNNIPSQTWTCADNSITELTVTDFKALNTLAAQRSGQLHEQYNKLKVYVDTLKTVEDVEVVNFDTEVV